MILKFEKENVLNIPPKKHILQINKKLIPEVQNIIYNKIDKLEVLIGNSENKLIVNEE